MDLARFQRKLVLRITSPSEYLQVVGRHWFLMMVLTAMGTLIGFAIVRGEPAIYQARATLQLNPNEPIVEPGSGSRPQKLDHAAFINDQIAVLMSDTVLLTLVRSLELERSESFESVPNPSGETIPQTPGVVREVKRVYRSLSGRVHHVMANMRLPPAGSAEERRNQRAIGQFRVRSQVIPEPSSHNVHLVIYGTRREDLVPELETWISAYRRRIEEFTEESVKRFLSGRMDYWTRVLGEKRKVLQRFHAGNPDVGETMQKIIQEQVIRQRIFLDGLQYRLTDPNGHPSAASQRQLLPLQPAQEGDVLVDRLRKTRQDLELERILLLGEFTDKSQPVRAHDEKIRRVDESLEAIGGTTVSGSPGTQHASNLDEPDFDAALKENIAQARKDLEDLHRRLVEIDSKMAEFEKLEADYKYAEDKLRSYERSMDWSMEFTQGQKLVQVQVWDKPTASTEPVNRNKMIKVLYAAAGGLIIGFLLAFLREFFAATIRCKRDVANELGLRVVGVVPSE